MNEKLCTLHFCAFFSDQWLQGWVQTLCLDAHYTCTNEPTGEELCVGHASGGEGDGLFGQLEIRSGRIG